MERMEVPPVEAEVDERTVIRLELLLAKFKLEAVSVVGPVKVPFLLIVIDPVKEDNKLSETLMPPEMREIYAVLSLPAGLVSCMVMIEDPPSSPSVAEFVAPAVNSLPA